MLVTVIVMVIVLPASAATALYVGVAVVPLVNVPPPLLVHKIVPLVAVPERANVPVGQIAPPARVVIVAVGFGFTTTVTFCLLVQPDAVKVNS